MKYQMADIDVQCKCGDGMHGTIVPEGQAEGLIAAFWAVHEGEGHGKEVES